MKIRRHNSWLVRAVVLALISAAALVATAPVASADPVYGTQSMAYSGVSNPPTSDKPQSKLWWNDGTWWADMWKTGTGWSIYRLDRASGTWVDTGVVNDVRGSTLADTLWDGSHLYIASHVVTITGDGTPKPSLSGQPAKLYRYSYSGGRYTLDSGFPTQITNNSSESMTIDIDSTGVVWATWTQVAGDATSGFTNTVYVNNADNEGANWATPYVIPVANPNPAPDDISAVVAYGNNKLGVMWSDHLTGAMWWATRTDGTAPNAASSWKVQPAIQGKGQSDDHLNLKTLQADSTGRVFAAVKTSLNDISPDPTLPQLLLLVFKPGTGAFSRSTISVAGDCVSRPQIVLDTQNNLIRAFQTAPPTSVTGCAYSGVAGSIYEKTASMDNPVFAAGRGTPVIQSASSSNMNDVTTSKQSVNSTTGIVVMASDNVARRYWFSDRPLGAVPPPPPPSSGGISVVGSSTTNAAASAGVALAAPPGTDSGDVLVAAITADLSPSMASVPPGWTAMVNGLSISSGARTFAYYHVVGAADPANYAWTLSSAVKWGAGVTAYRGVNTTTPLDSTIMTAVDTTYAATSISLGSINTASDGAMLIGGAACDCGTPVFSAPSGWTERWEAAANQLAEEADAVQATAGASGTATWTMSAARAVAVWRTALKPAS
ncbi:hypothetical protein [Arthrobacter sp. 754]|uniref:hypothetical protein n=1 Tax=Arthrobacter sp. 754 TaxID=3156315 RepID=UPI003391098F